MSADTPATATAMTTVSADTDTKGTAMTAQANGHAPYQHTDTADMSADTMATDAAGLADRVAKLETAMAALSVSADTSVRDRRVRVSTAMEVFRWVTAVALVAVAIWGLFH